MPSFTCERTDLLNPLKTLALLCRSGMNPCRLTAKDTTLFLESTGSFFWYGASLPLSSPWTADPLVIHPYALAEFLGALRADTITGTVKARTLVISAPTPSGATSSIALPLLDPDSLDPAPALPDAINACTLEPSHAQELGRLLPFIAKSDATGRGLDHVFFQVEQHPAPVLRALASDGYRLSSLTLPIHAEGSETCLLPAPALKAFLADARHHDPDVPLRLDITREGCLLSTQRTQLSVPRPQHRYPDVTKILASFPASPAIALEVPREELAATVKRVLAVHTDARAVITIHPKGDHLRLATIDHHTGSAQDSLPLACRATHPFAFTGSYLLDALKAFRGETITIASESPTSMFHFRSQDDPAFSHVLMPIAQS